MEPKHMNPGDEDQLTVKQVAEALARPVYTIRKLMRDGVISPVVRLTPRKPTVPRWVVRRVARMYEVGGGDGRRSKIKRIVRRKKSS